MVKKLSKTEEKIIDAKTMSETDLRIFLTEVYNSFLERAEENNDEKLAEIAEIIDEAIDKIVDVDYPKGGK